MKKSERLLWFVGGIAIGAAAAGKAGSLKSTGQLRNRFASMQSSLGNSAAQLNHTIRSEAGEFTKKIRKQISSPIPDLYKATENIAIEQPEITYGW
ncbi:MAG: hypothetical protein R3283_05445 [Balneolaceae bacterium]|nr:hypothetical protein [Balneolaceae bacterium]